MGEKWAQRDLDGIYVVKVNKKKVRALIWKGKKINEGGVVVCVTIKRIGSVVHVFVASVGGGVCVCVV